jgi:hypothetical protein
VKTLLKISIEHDPDVENPAGEDNWWKLYSFSRRHHNFKHPDEIRSHYGIGLLSKLRHGTAFWLGYFEHGQCQWALSGEQWQCPWDSVNRAGILIADLKDLPMGFENRQRVACNFCEIYTDWCNGNCYWYSIKKTEVPDDWDGDPDGDIARNDWEGVDSCGGFIGDSGLAEAIQESIKSSGLSNAEPAIVTGDCKWFADYHNLMPKGTRK